jgi:hypothetical protein
MGRAGPFSGTLVIPDGSAAIREDAGAGVPARAGSGGEQPGCEDNDEGDERNEGAMLHGDLRRASATAMAVPVP